MVSLFSTAGRLLYLALFAVRPVLAVWPVPESISTGDGVFWIDHGLEVSYNGQNVRYKPLAIPICNLDGVMANGEPAWVSAAMAV